MINYTEEIINNLFINATELFNYEKDDYEKIRDFYKKAFRENRFMYLYDKQSNCIGYLVFYLFNQDDINFMLNKKNGFDFPEHNKNEKCFYIEDCVIFKQFRNPQNLLYLRKVFREIFPQIERVCWHKSIKEGKKIFNKEYHGGLENAKKIIQYN